MRWRTPSDLLALALLFCIGALMAVVAVELVSLPPPLFPRPMNQTPVALISGSRNGKSDPDADVRGDPAGNPSAVDVRNPDGAVPETAAATPLHTPTGTTRVHGEVI